jgi:phosphoglycolate phosphatase
MADPKLSKVRALIFDLDGTLIDSKQDLIHSVNAMLRELGRRELAEETISGYIGHGAPQLVTRALGDGCTEEERQRALQFFLSYYELHKMDTTCAYPGVPETLEKLASIPMTVLTNKPVRISVRILDAMGLSKYFRAIYGGNSFETKKPDPLGARTILRELGAEPSEVLLVGDSEVDVQTARNAGTLAAAVNYGFGVHDRGAHPADIYLERFGELANFMGW